MVSLCITGIFTQVPFSTVFPATRIPNWFKHRRKGHTIRIKASPNWYSNNFLGFAVSAVMYIGNSSSTYCNLDSHDHNLESGSSRIYSFIDDHMRELEFTRGDHLWLAYIPSVFSFKWSRINFTFHADNWFCMVKYCGICPMYIKSSSSDEYDNDWNYSRAVMIVMREILVEVSFLISFNIMQWTEAPKKPQVEEACRKM